ncbi:MAG TPA: sulfurtransferase [Sphingomonadaceae bacterium]|nr:sulfurtransferase [Sphingomonadaceae bacterium]
MDMLVSTEWLAKESGAADLKLLDASYHALDPSRDPAAEYEAGHITGALYLDLPNLKDAANPVPAMLPSAAQFTARMEALGVNNGDRILLYDDSPHRTSARAWWMFIAFGAREVAILDGGLAKWKAEGRPLATGLMPPQSRGDFTAHLDEAAVRTLAAMKANVASGMEEVLDARSAARFAGEEPDPRGMPVGHIPGSRSLPYNRLLNPDGTFKSPRALRAAFTGAGIDWGRPLVTTCGSGVTAAVLLFAARLIGKGDVALYDGSWSEWGADPATPKATGAA